MSITASWLIVAIVVFRLFFKKVPKNYFCILWGIVAIRLICPFSVQSIFGIVPTVEIQREESGIASDIESSDEDKWLPNDVIISDYQSGNLNITIKDDNVEYPKDSVVVDSSHFLESLSIITILTMIWIFGMLVLAFFSMISFIKLKRDVSASLPIGNGMYICDTIHSPFILGMFCPKIYIPSDLSEKQISFVMAHEKMHLKRKDNYWKIIGFLFVIVYWFHPLIWIAYILFCRDIEFACDEAVIKTMEKNDRVMYVKTLIYCSSGTRRKFVNLLAFGEIGMKERVKVMMRYKKPSLRLMVIASIICVSVVACFGTSSNHSDTEQTVLESTETEEISTEGISTEGTSTEETSTEETSEKDKNTYEIALSEEEWREAYDNGWNYPIYTNDKEQWNELDYKEQVAACNMPQSLLESISTQELTTLALEYPFLIDFFMFDSYTAGMRSIWGKSNIINELYYREDVGTYLLEAYESEEIQNAFVKKEWIKMSFQFKVVREHLSETELFKVNAILNGNL